MKRLPQILIFVFLAAISLSAAPLCTNATLQTYLNNNNGLSNACEINGVLFFNFTYTGTLATDFVPASDVNVVVNPSGLPGTFNLNGQWSIQSMDTDPAGINGPAFEDLHLTFDVMSVGALPIVTVHNLIFYSTIAGGTVNSSATCDSPCAVTGGEFTNDTKNLLTSTLGPFTIHNDFQLKADGENDQAHFSIITNQVTVTQNLISQGVPEPVTCALAGGALILLGLMKRRNR